MGDCRAAETQNRGSRRWQFTANHRYSGRVYRAEFRMKAYGGLEYRVHKSAVCIPMYSGKADELSTYHASLASPVYVNQPNKGT